MALQACRPCRVEAEAALVAEEEERRTLCTITQAEEEWVEEWEGRGWVVEVRVAEEEAEEWGVEE